MGENCNIKDLVKKYLSASKSNRNAPTEWEAYLHEIDKIGAHNDIKKCKYMKCKVDVFQHGCADLDPTDDIGCERRATSKCEGSPETKKVGSYKGSSPFLKGGKNKTKKCKKGFKRRRTCSIQRKKRNTSQRKMSFDSGRRVNTRRKHMYIGGAEGEDETFKKLATIVSRCNADVQERIDEILTPFPDLVTKTTDDGKTLLHYVCKGYFEMGNESEYQKGRRINLIQYLFDKGININAEDKDGNTPLFYASVKKECCVDKLIELGADIKHVNRYGQTPLNYNIVNTSFFWYNIDKIINDEVINVPDNDSNTPLINAVIRDRLSTVKKLIEKNADLNISEKHGFTALRYATILLEQSNLKTTTQYNTYDEIIQCLNDANAIMDTEESKNKLEQYQNKIQQKQQQQKQQQKQQQQQEEEKKYLLNILNTIANKISYINKGEINEIITLLKKLPSEQQDRLIPLYNRKINDLVENIATYNKDNQPYVIKDFDNLIQLPFINNIDYNHSVLKTYGITNKDELYLFFHPNGIKGTIKKASELFKNTFYSKNLDKNIVDSGLNYETANKDELHQNSSGINHVPIFKMPREE